MWVPSQALASFSYHYRFCYRFVRSNGLQQTCCTTLLCTLAICTTWHNKTPRRLRTRRSEGLQKQECNPTSNLEAMASNLEGLQPNSDGLQVQEASVSAQAPVLKSFWMALPRQIASDKDWTSSPTADSRQQNIPLLGARTLLGAKGITTRNKCIATSNKKLLV